MINVLVALARAIGRIRRRLVILQLCYGLHMYSVGGRILIRRLLVPLFLLLRDLRYVRHDLVWLLLHLRCQDVL